MWYALARHESPTTVIILHYKLYTCLEFPLLSSLAIYTTIQNQPHYTKHAVTAVEVQQQIAMLPLSRVRASIG
jgi:hypothetical protein